VVNEAPTIPASSLQIHAKVEERVRRSPGTIYEGTSEIQRLVIARNISGMHIR
jgi:alkylation response protein AidB-like acyl-CoA dehydrogenase